MTFTKSLPRPGVRASSKGQALPSARGLLFDASAYRYDLVSLFTHLAALATAHVDRAHLFHTAHSLGYRPSPFFGRVLSLVRGLGYDFAHACQRVAHMAQEEIMHNILLRLGNSMASGEAEGAFLRRELRVLMQDYVNEFERDLESLRKWTDAFVALEAAAIMILLVAIVSNLIYQLGPAFLLITEVGVLAVGVLGLWLIRRVSPFDPMIYHGAQGSREVRWLRLLGRTLAPGALVLGLLTYVMTGKIGPALLASALLLAPLGLYVFLLEQRVNSRDRDIADFVRALGGVTAARGGTIADSLRHMDRKSIGSLEPQLKRLLQRLDAGLDSMRAWAYFMAETGSELVRRVVSAFWDAMRMGGEPEASGNIAADLGLQVYLLRARRRLVSSTFNFVIVPLHGVLVGLLLFINEIVGAFNAGLLRAQEILAGASVSSFSPQELGIPVGLTFHSVDTQHVMASVTWVALALTCINTLAAQMVAGGSHYKLALFGALNMGATGLALVAIPPLAARMFGSMGLGSF
jgi:flagellar protein FlaJ